MIGMKSKSILIAALIISSAATRSMAGGEPARPRTGRWRAKLEIPQREIPFELDLSSSGSAWKAVVINAKERIELSNVILDGSQLVIRFPHYDSEIRATLESDGGRMSGEWVKRAGPDKWTRLPFHAKAGDDPRFPGRLDLPSAMRVAGRWTVKFEKSEDPAVGVFEALPDGTLTGTFLTTTGDYGFLAGKVSGPVVRLSSFDGAHAFLFHAELSNEGELHGDFWSRDAWHETWTARPDAEAKLPDDFELAKTREGVKLDDLIFPDLDGRRKSLNDPAFAGKARIIEVFGSWCPNCNDASKFFAELDALYRTRGLSIVGLAFELTGDFTRDAEQVRRFAAFNGVKYPLLVGGVNDREKASAAFPLLQKINAYPTAVILDGRGNVRAVHSGFSGPATGDAYAALRERFTTLIENLLAESP